VAPLWAAEDLGFAKQGVSVNAIFIRQAPVLGAALTAGDVHAAYTGGTTVLIAITGGADLKIIGSLTNRLGYDMVAEGNNQNCGAAVRHESSCRAFWAQP
jgi:ABC-type nitrate/sulfonate/bicarbonate transport system substrate-binding protein